MASVTVSTAEVQGLLDDVAAAYSRENMPYLKQVMQRECPVDHGILRQQHQIMPMRRLRAGLYVLRINAIPYYAVIVHQGRREVRPVRAKVLRWRAKGGAIVFSMKSKAVPANPWMYRAMRLVGLNAHRTFK